MSLLRQARNDLGLVADGLIEMFGADEDSEAARAAALMMAAFLRSNIHWSES